MDLQQAKVEAAARSKRTGKKSYIIAGEDGNCIINDAPLKGHIHTFDKGVEVSKDTPVITPPVKLGKPVEETKPKKLAKVAAKQKATDSKEIKNKTKMATATKSPAKKTAAKKTAKKVAAPVKKTAAGLPAGKKVMMKIKDIVKHLKAGKRVYIASTGRPANLKFNMERPNQDAEREVIVPS